MTTAHTALKEQMNELGKEHWEAYSVTMSDEDRIIHVFLKRPYIKTGRTPC